MSKVRKSKNQLRRERAKLKKQGENEDNKVDDVQDSNAKAAEVKDEDKAVEQPKETSNQEIQVLEIKEDPLFAQFQGVFEKFEKNEETPDQEGVTTNNHDQSETPESTAAPSSSEDDSDDDEDQQISKRQLRKLNKVSLADLKTSTSKPQVVEWYDVDSHEPYLHVALKSQFNCVPVPTHWTNKREYLSGRKGIERKPFQLPQFILDTGIQDMRDTSGESEDTLRKSQRDRVQPKMGKLDIDYQKLHDAFFKFQTKPRLYAFGDLYYEGRESEDTHSGELSHIKPGVVSKELRKALGMQENDTGIPPPWLQVMAKIGKPPSYKDLYFPGLDSAYSNTGYSTEIRKAEGKSSTKAGELELWGQLSQDVEEEESEEEEEEEDDDDEGEEEDVDENGDVSEEETAPGYESEEGNEKVSISEFGGVKPTTRPTNSSTKNKPLYQILQENNKATNGSLSNKGYEIPTTSDSVSEKKRSGDDESQGGKKKARVQGNS